MNEIIIRTNKGSYSPGDTVYGAVYLNITNPTAGRGVKIHVDGYEHFEYQELLGNSLSSNLISEEKKSYINCHDVVLYAGAGPFPLGNYIFPFKIPLPCKLPGSFFTSSEEGSWKWTAGVHYTIEAQMIDAENIQVKLYIPIKSIPLMLQDQDTPKALCRCHTVRWMKMIRRKLYFTVRFKDATYQSGDSAKLRIIFTNNTQTSIKLIKLMLVQELMFCSKSLIDVNRSSNRIMTRFNDTILPRGQHIIWQMQLMEEEAGSLNKTLDNILIPLKENGKEIPPTVQGDHVQCHYHVDIFILLNNGDEVPITLDGPHVLPPDNVQWLSCKLPDWVGSGTVKMSLAKIKGQFGVTDQILSGECFSGLPGFQAL